MLAVEQHSCRNHSFQPSRRWDLGLLSNLTLQGCNQTNHITLTLRLNSPAYAQLEAGKVQCRGL